MFRQSAVQSASRSAAAGASAAVAGDVEDIGLCDWEVANVQGIQPRQLLGALGSTRLLAEDYADQVDHVRVEGEAVGDAAATAPMHDLNDDNQDVVVAAAEVGNHAAVVALRRPEVPEADGAAVVVALAAAAVAAAVALQSQNHFHRIPLRTA
jgi:hypothetical protein